MSAFQIISQLILHPRTKGIPYVAEHGTLKQGIIIALVLLLINVILTVFEDMGVAIWAPLLIDEEFVSPIDVILMWFVLMGAWTGVLFFFVEAFTKEDIPFKRVLMAICYNESLNFPTVILLSLKTWFGLWMFNLGSYDMWMLGRFIALWPMLVVGVYYLLCTIGLYRKVLGITTWTIVGAGITFALALVGSMAALEFL